MRLTPTLIANFVFISFVALGCQTSIEESRLEDVAQSISWDLAMSQNDLDDIANILNNHPIEEPEVFRLQFRLHSLEKQIEDTQTSKDEALASLDSEQLRAIALNSTRRIRDQVAALRQDAVPYE